MALLTLLDSMDVHQQLQRAAHNTARSIGLALVTAVNIIGTIRKDDWGGSSGYVKTGIIAFVNNTLVSSYLVLILDKYSIIPTQCILSPKG